MSGFEVHLSLGLVQNSMQAARMGIGRRAQRNGGRKVNRMRLVALVHGHPRNDAESAFEIDVQ